MTSSWRRMALVVAAVAGSVPALGLAAPAAGADPVLDVRINEIEASGGSPGDWVELFNKGTEAADISGWVLKDNDDGHVITIEPETVLAAGAYLVIDTDVPGYPGNPNPFGLGSGADSVRLFAPGNPVAVDSFTWTTGATVTYGRCPNGTGGFVDTAASTKGAANSCPVTASPVKINEIESSGGSPGDWVELLNTGAAPVDISGWVIKDADNDHVYTINAGTTLAAGAYFVADVDQPGYAGNPAPFGLGGGDSVRLYTSASAPSTVDSYTWTSAAGVTYGRCPNGTGAFADTQTATRGAANNCAGDPLPWPGAGAVATADVTNVLGGNMSGLAYQPSGTDAPGVLWAVKNGPGTLYRLVFDGTNWVPDTADGWANGKALKYTDGNGDVDAEGVTLVNDDPTQGIYVATERNNSISGTSRPAVLRYDVSDPGTTLVATHDWNLTADLPGLGANLGLEAIQWLSDDFLVSEGFKDEATGTTYDPDTYTDHGTGLFFVGVEANGRVIGYALDHTDGTFTRVATVETGFPAGVMELEFEPESTHLWAVCDDTCGGRHATLDIAPDGADAGEFVITAVYGRPSGMGNLNNEGFAISPRALCVGGQKPVFWTDDANTGQHALRTGSIDCTPRAAQTIDFPQPDALTVGAAPVALSATASSGLPVTYGTEGPCVVVEGPALQATDAGTCVVTATQPGDADHAPAPAVERSVVATADVPEPAAVADFDGDGLTDLSIFRTSNVRWYIAGAPSVGFGTATDIPVPADWDGDGDVDIAVFRPSTGRWYVQGDLTSVGFGTDGDVPVPGQWDADPEADIAVYRPSTGRWYIDGVAASIQFGGVAGDIPVPADYDGDGQLDIAVFRSSTGRWYMHGVAGSVAFGTDGDVPVPGQWDADPEADIAVYRPSTGRWYVQGAAASTQWGGVAGDVPVPGQYDADPELDIAVYRPSNGGRWYVLEAGGSVQFGGGAGDVPLVLPAHLR